MKRVFAFGFAEDWKSGHLMARVKRGRGWVDIHHAEVCFEGRTRNVIRAANIVIPPSGNNVKAGRYDWDIPKRTNHKLYLFVSREFM
jgi:hypothetical protein